MDRLQKYAVSHLKPALFLYCGVTSLKIILQSAASAHLLHWPNITQFKHLTKRIENNIVKSTKCILITTISPNRHLVSPRRQQFDVNKRRTTIYKGARRPATADVPNLSTTKHFHDTQPLILFHFVYVYSTYQLLFVFVYSLTVNLFADYFSSVYSLSSVTFIIDGALGISNKTIVLPPQHK
ncbi:hypothetical protein AGLY_013919 [Aphis glycines]|uniref:Uncharacterized protein n=1 Tax=Aphis glycines TaxID=307491 RepID=A0A6G0T4W2_APHGL|nr:hypothetical protein AGLY_013919 [Aphis glycines]